MINWFLGLDPAFLLGDIGTAIIAATSIYATVTYKRNISQERNDDAEHEEERVRRHFIHCIRGTKAASEITFNTMKQHQFLAAPNFLERAREEIIACEKPFDCMDSYIRLTKQTTY